MPASAGFGWHCSGSIVNSHLVTIQCANTRWYFTSTLKAYSSCPGYYDDSPRFPALLVAQLARHENHHNPSAYQTSMEINVNNKSLYSHGLGNSPPQPTADPQFENTGRDKHLLRVRVSFWATIFQKSRQCVGEQRYDESVGAQGSFQPCCSYGRHGNRKSHPDNTCHWSSSGQGSSLRNTTKPPPHMPSFRLLSKKTLKHDMVVGRMACHEALP